MANTNRRQYCLGMLGGVLGLAGCGGGGGGGGGSSGDGGQTQTPTGNVPPASGAFGGGQGKILFVEGGNSPRAIYQIDLATRKVAGLASFGDDDLLAYYVGGVTRANDGSFLVTYQRSMSARMHGIRHHSANGDLISDIQTEYILPQDATISPDGRFAAYTPLSYQKIPGRATDFDNEIRIELLDLRSRQARYGVLVALGEGPSDKRSYVTSAPIWTPGGQLYVMTKDKIFHIDPQILTSRSVAYDLDGASNAVSAPDGQSIWFSNPKGNPGGSTIWSVDVTGGVSTRRSLRSSFGGQYAPGFSPDGSWLLMHENELRYFPGVLMASYYVCAVRNTGEVIDTQNLQTAIRTAENSGFTSSGRVAWY